MKYYSGDLIKKIKMGGTWGGYGGQESCIHGFWWGDPWEGDYLEDLGVAGRIILKWFGKKWDGEAWTGLLWLRIGKGDMHL
jgi:hypothetical protein